jgi:hypothetical protein
MRRILHRMTGAARSTSDGSEPSTEGTFEAAGAAAADQHPRHDQALAKPVNRMSMPPLGWHHARAEALRWWVE